jgi:hypothetical protein
MARPALMIAIGSSGVVAILLAAASLGVWMEGATLHPTPRVNAFTVGCGIVPIAALGWIVYLWSRVPLTGPRVALLILVSGTLALIAGYCFFAAMISALFVG